MSERKPIRWFQFRIRTLAAGATGAAIGLALWQFTPFDVADFGRIVIGGLLAPAFMVTRLVDVFLEANTSELFLRFVAIPLMFAIYGAAISERPQLSTLLRIFCFHVACFLMLLIASHD